MKLIAEAVATFLGVGRWPIAAATAGSAAAVLVYWALPFDGGSPWFWLLTAAVTLAGVGAAHRLSVPGDEDPKRVVIDEVAGMWVTLLFIPPTWAWLLVAFFVFRALDILKPFGIRRLERLPGGIGIMADDLAAGAVGAIALNVIRLIFF